MTDLQSHFCLFEGLQNNSEMRCRQQNSSATAGQASVIPLRAAVLVRRLLEQMFVCVRIRVTRFTSYMILNGLYIVVCP